MKKTKDTYLTDLYKKLNDIDKKIEFQQIRSSTIDISDRTSTYEFIKSMSLPGHPHSNAPMERYFNTLKTELIYQNSYSSETDLYDAISNFAYTYYNKQRPHSYNNYKTPYTVRTSHK